MLACLLAAPCLPRYRPCAGLGFRPFGPKRPPTVFLTNGTLVTSETITNTLEATTAAAAEL